MMEKRKMADINHKRVSVNGIELHIAEIGDDKKGTILFLHGFPQVWYTWRHQLLALSAAGYRTVAPDLRGYGESDAPSSASEYTAFHVVGDLIGLIDSLGVEKVLLVGHDWGALIAWYFCLFRSDRVKALVNLSVPFVPRDPNKKTVESYREAFGDDFYICRFQKVGDMEEEYDSIEPTKLMKKFLAVKDSKPPIIPKGKLKADAENPSTLPSWLSEDDSSYYAQTFKKTGFTGALNYYRNMDLNWELMAPWTGAELKVPVKFIMGSEDLTYNFPGVKDYIHKGGFNKSVPLLEDVVIMEGVGHFINEEKDKEVSMYIQQFFDKF